MARITSANRINSVVNLAPVNPHNDPANATIIENHKMQEKIEPFTRRFNVGIASSAVGPTSLSNFSDRLKSSFERTSFVRDSFTSSIPVGQTLLKADSLNQQLQATIQQMPKPISSLSDAEKKLLLNSLMQQIQRAMQQTTIKATLIHEIALNSINKIRG
jgi:hypothetical protein